MSVYECKDGEAEEAEEAEAAAPDEAATLVAAVTAAVEVEEDGLVTTRLTGSKVLPESPAAAPCGK